MLDHSQSTAVLELHRQSHGIRAIARLLRLSRGAVRDRPDRCAILALDEAAEGGANVGFRREDASLHVVFVSDDDDHSDAHYGQCGQRLDWRADLCRRCGQEQ
jgi:hypothetical protein